MNAWELESQFAPQSFDAIIWNHPHLGIEDFRLHRFLLAHFFRSATNALAPGGHVIVSLVRGQETRWGLVEQATREGTGMQLVQCAPFLDEDYPGYVCKRNKNGQTFKNSKTLRHVGVDMSSFSFTFAAGCSDRQGGASGPAAGSPSTAGDMGGAPEEPVTTPTATVASISASSTPTTTTTTSAAAARPAATATATAAVDTKPAAADALIAHVLEPTPAAIRSAPAPAAGFPCLHCDKVFPSARGIKTHTRQVHELKKYGADWTPAKTKKLDCPHCGRV